MNTKRTKKCTWIVERIEEASFKDQPERTFPPFVDASSRTEVSTDWHCTKFLLRFLLLRAIVHARRFRFSSCPAGPAHWCCRCSAHLRYRSGLSHSACIGSPRPSVTFGTPILAGIREMSVRWEPQRRSDAIRNQPSCHCSSADPFGCRVIGEMADNK